MKSLYIVLLSDVICLLCTVTRDSMADFCSASSGSVSTYGREFIVPFPHVNLTLSGAFQYQIYVTNPNSVSINVSVVSMGESWWNTSVYIPSKSFNYLTFNTSYMMQGQGQFSKFAHLTAAFNFGVHVTSTEKMDGFTSLPVESWGMYYLAVTYCKPADDGKCQIIIIANQSAKVNIKIPAQDTNTISVMYTKLPAQEQTESVTLKPFEVYQLQCPYDITGAQISSNVSVGVLSGSSGTSVGASTATHGAFMEFLPPDWTLGTEFVLHRTRWTPAAPDLVLIMAVQNSTVVFMSTGQPRFALNRFQHLKRYFNDYLVHIRSDRPVVVVKFSQSDDTLTTYPTMSVIVPIELYLPNATIIIPAMTDGTTLVQNLLVIGKNSTLGCLNVTNYSLMNSSYLAGTDLFGNLYTMTSSVNAPPTELSCNLTSSAVLGVYLTITGTSISHQFPVAYGLDLIQTYCSNNLMDTTYNSCDLYDQPTVSGDRDIFGKNFTFLLPVNSESDNVSLYFSNPSSLNLIITVTTPANLSLVNGTYRISSNERYLNISLPADVLCLNGSNNCSDRVLHIEANEEISVIPIVTSFNAKNPSAYAARVITDEVLDKEYYAVTFCVLNLYTLCRLQITAFHKGFTTVKVRLKLKKFVTFNGRNYTDGEVICQNLGQFHSLQLESVDDMTGTHILSNKPISIWTSSYLTKGKFGGNFDSLAEHLPPVETWGSQFIIQKPPINCTLKGGRICNDTVKIVASTGNTEVTIKFSNTTNFYDNAATLANAGDYCDFWFRGFGVVSSNKPVLVVQITLEYSAQEVSMSFVAPVNQYIRKADLVIEISTVNMTHLLVTSQVNSGQFKIDNSNVNMTYEDSFEASYAAWPLADTFSFIENNSSFSFGGQVYWTSFQTNTYMYPLAFKMERINKVCQVTKATPGDKIDNDCDGVSDEEPCLPDILPQDNDKDGMVNEDCSSTTVSTSILSESTSMIDPSVTSHAYSLTPTALTPQAVPTTSFDLYSSTHFASLSASSPMNSYLATPLSSPMNSYLATPLSSPMNSYLVTPLSSFADLTSVTDSASAAGLPSTVTYSQTTPLVSSASTTVPASVDATATSTGAAPSLADLSTTLTSSVASTTSSLAPSTSTKTSTTTTPTISSTHNQYCGCQCPPNILTSRPPSSEIVEMTSSIHKDLGIDSSETSAKRRTLTSATDERKSAQAVGYFGVAIFVSVFAAIVLLDVGYLVRNVQRIIRLCKK